MELNCKVISLLQLIFISVILLVSNTQERGNTEDKGIEGSQGNSTD